MTKPEKPPVLTDETFFFPPPELANFLTVFGGRVFSKADGSNSYFVEVEPGSYTLYRAGFGPCLCMGSVSFDAPAGKIVSFGEFDPVSPNEAASSWFTPPAAGMPKPPQLANLPIEPAQLHAAGKLPNYFGTLIDRMPPIAGVLAYNRDVPLDVASGEKPVEPVR